MKKIILIIAIIAFVGCKEETPTENTLLSTEESYIPLHVGNEWIFKLQTGNIDTTTVIKVIGKTKLNNENYFIVVDNFKNMINKKYGIDTNYIRTENGTKYFIHKESKDFIYRFFDDTTIKAVDSYTNYDIKSKVHTESINTVKSEVGDFNSYMEVEEGTIENDGGTVFYYVEGIGLVYSYWFKGKITLVYANVNDVEYGEK